MKPSATAQHHSFRVVLSALSREMTKGPIVTCRELADFILDYVDGELDDEVRRRFERHLGLCPNCVRYLDAYKKTIVMGRRAFEEVHGDPDRPAAEAGVPEDLIDAILRARP
jgi:anti-sigma factor RsiW